MCCPRRLIIRHRNSPLRLVNCCGMARGALIRCQQNFGNRRGNVLRVPGTAALAGCVRRSDWVERRLQMKRRRKEKEKKNRPTSGLISGRERIGRAVPRSCNGNGLESNHLATSSLFVPSRPRKSAWPCLRVPTGRERHGSRWFTPVQTDSLTEYEMSECLKDSSLGSPRSTPERHCLVDGRRHSRDRRDMASLCRRGRAPSEEACPDIRTGLTSWLLPDVADAHDARRWIVQDADDVHKDALSQSARAVAGARPTYY